MTISHSHYQGLSDLSKGAGSRKSSLAEYQCFQNYYHGHQLLSPNPHYIGNVRSSVNHWQLRDLVKIDSETGSVFHSYRDLIRVLSVKNSDAEAVKSRTFLRLPYFARCFNHAPGGLFVTGGLDNSLAKLFLMKIPNLTDDSGVSRKKPDGLFSVYSPAMASEMNFHLGDMINNAVTIYPDANSTASYLSYVCNNDSNLYVVDISDSGVLANRSIVCEPNVSLNNVMQSPDRSFLAATGDSGSIFLLDPSQPNATIKTIRTKNDSGFGLSFHSNGNTLASAFQNGSCLLFDLRKTNEAFHEIKSTRPNHQSGAFRCCKFINSPIQDLLAILEHVGRVHLIDLRNLEKDNHQVLAFPLALDQFSHYNYQKNKMNQKLKGRRRSTTVPTNQSIDETLVNDGEDGASIDDDFDEPDILSHKRWEIFGHTNPQFSAPLVYDFRYLAYENPKLFKGYEYEPQIAPVDIAEEPDELDQKALSWRHDIDNQQLPRENQPNPTNANSLPLSSELEAQYFLRYFHDAYMQSGNHINGEMQLSGFDWFDSKLYIGSEDGGLTEWNVNVRGRRSFGSFSFA